MVRIIAVLATLHAHLAFGAVEAPPRASKLEPTPTIVAPRILDKQRPGPFTITRQSEVRLDGRLFRYDQIPYGAEIILLEVTPQQEVLRIHFRSKKSAK